MSAGVQAHNDRDTIATLKAELTAREEQSRELGDRIRRALEVADEEKVYRCGGKPKHTRMADILRGK
jgi:hypothetical protein